MAVITVGARKEDVEGPRSLWQGKPSPKMSFHDPITTTWLLAPASSRALLGTPDSETPPPNHQSVIKCSMNIRKLLSFQVAQSLQPDLPLK